jgi:arylsulfatase A-like enzyme
VFFEHAFSTSSWTKPSIGSLLTSRIPSEHGAGFMAEACWPVVAEACAIAAGVTVSWAPFGWTEIKVLVARRFQLSDTPQV